MQKRREIMEWNSAAGGADAGFSPKPQIISFLIPSAIKPVIVIMKTPARRSQSYIMETCLISVTKSLLTIAMRTPISRMYPKT